MKNTILYTAKPLNLDTYRPLLINGLKNCEPNGDDGIMITKPYTLFLDFDPEKLSDSPEDVYSEDEITAILSFLGTDDAYIYDIVYHRPIDVKRVLKILLSQGERIYVEADYDIEWTGSAEDYIKEYTEDERSKEYYDEVKRKLLGK